MLQITMKITGLEMFVLVVMLAKLANAKNLHVSMKQMGVLLAQVVQQYLLGCHLVIMTTAPHSYLFASIHR